MAGARGGVGATGRAGDFARVLSPKKALRRSARSIASRPRLAGDDVSQVDADDVGDRDGSEITLAPGRLVLFEDVAREPVLSSAIVALSSLCYLPSGVSDDPDGGRKLFRLATRAEATGGGLWSDAASFEHPFDGFNRRPILAREAVGFKRAVFARASWRFTLRPNFSAAAVRRM